jgi:hypothetical protein
MTNPQYLVTIQHVPLRATGRTQSYAAAYGTYSAYTYSGDYFVAVMPEVSLSATGSSYNEALTNLLLVATASTSRDSDLGPLSNNVRVINP